MPRATNAPASRRRRKRVLKQAKGYFGNKSRLFRYANDAVKHGLQYAYRDRRAKKRTWRSLWITRVNIACRANGITYSRFIEGLNAAGVTLNRKVLADIAAQDEAAFAALVEKAQAALKAKTDAPETADNLTRIEGVGPKIQELFIAAGIKSFADLAGTSVERLKDILAEGGTRFGIADPTTWPEQAALAAKGDWEALKKLTDELKGGRRV